MTRFGAQARYARGQLERMKSLLDAGSATRAEYEATEAQATAAENNLVEARARLDVLLNGTRLEDIQATRAQMDQLEAQQRHLEEDLRLLNLVSPVDGIVATPSHQLKALPGQLVTKGALIAKVYDFRTVTAQIVVSEKEIADIRVGQPVALKARAYPDQVFRGTVTAIATSAEGTASGSAPAPAAAAGSGPLANRTFIVTTRIDNGSLLLRPGMTGRAKISCGKRPVIELISRRVARTVKVEFWSWW